MAESTLSLNFPELQKEVSDRGLGWGRTIGSLSAEQLELVQSIINSGLRQFLFPPPLGGRSHRWSFLSPVTTMMAWTDIAVDSVVTITSATVTGVYNAGTGKTTLTSSVASFVSADVGKSVVITATGTFTASSYSSSTILLVTGDATCSVKQFTVDGRTVLVSNTGKFYWNMVGKSIAITTTGTFPICTYTSVTQISVTGDARCTAKTFAITGNGTYDLPDNIGYVVDWLTFEAGVGYPPIQLVDESQIRELQEEGTSTGQPRYAAVRAKAPTGTIGQRYEIVFWPTPSSNYTLYYSGIYFPDAPSGTQYPMGGMPHAETILQSCLAIAEQREDQTRGVQYALFLERLAASIEYDISLEPDFLGYNGDPGTSRITVHREGDFYYDGTKLE
jgi:hypothetical protein